MDATRIQIRNAQQPANVYNNAVWTKDDGPRPLTSDLGNYRILRMKMLYTYYLLYFRLGNIFVKRFIIELMLRLVNMFQPLLLAMVDWNTTSQQSFYAANKPANRFKSSIKIVRKIVSCGITGK